LAMYQGDNRDTFPYTKPGWPTTPCVDLLAMQTPYLGTNNRAFYRCPAEKLLAFNYQLYQAEGDPTNALPFACSYYYYATFYNGQPQKVNSVPHASQKAIQVCFASANNALFNTDLDPPKNGAHGAGLNWLFVDGHSQFDKWNQMIPCSANLNRPYNYDNDPINAIDITN